MTSPHLTAHRSPLSAGPAHSSRAPHRGMGGRLSLADAGIALACSLGLILVLDLWSVLVEVVR